MKLRPVPGRRLAEHLLSLPLAMKKKQIITAIRSSVIAAEYEARLAFRGSRLAPEEESPTIPL